MKKNISEIYFYVLGGLIVLGFFVLMIILALKPVPEGNADSMNIVVGALIAAFSSVVGYFYGSSKGSKDKTEHLANLSKKEIDEDESYDALG